jgi:RHS repeat-associated protein
MAGIRANNETFTNYSYNNALLLTQMQTFDPNGGTIGDFRYTYDANGNWTEVQTPSATINYTYDNLNRLTGETLPDGTLIEYAYDAAGNRLTQKVTQGGNVTTTNYQYGAANQLTSVDSTAYTYDDNGNMTGDGVRTYSYDAANRLTEVKEGTDVIASFDYDADGRRTLMTTASGTIRFHYDGTSTRVLYETDGDRELIARYVYGANGQLLAMVRDGQTYYYHYNGHGDVIALTDANGTVVATYEYDAFGNHIGTTGNVNNPYRYAGYRWDEETGLYYLNARYYAPEIGRFITRDAFHGLDDDPHSLNWYNYAHSNPVMFVDPSGYSRELIMDMVSYAFLFLGLAFPLITAIRLATAIFSVFHIIVAWRDYSKAVQSLNGNAPNYQHQLRQYRFLLAISAIPAVVSILAAAIGQPSTLIRQGMLRFVALGIGTSISIFGTTYTIASLIDSRMSAFRKVGIV